MKNIKIIAVVLLLAMALHFGLGLSLTKNEVAKPKDDLISQRQKKSSLLQELDEKSDKITAELKAWFEQGKQEFYKLDLPCFKNIEDDFSLCLKEILPFVRFDYYGDNRHGAHSGSEKSGTTPMTTVSFCISFMILMLAKQQASLSGTRRFYKPPRLKQIF